MTIRRARCFRPDHAEVALGGSAPAEPVGTVNGTDPGDHGGKPLTGTTVKVSDVATFTIAADGTYSGQIPAGNYQVEVSKRTTAP